MPAPLADFNQILEDLVRKRQAGKFGAPLSTVVRPQENLSGIDGMLSRATQLITKPQAVPNDIPNQALFRALVGGARLPDIPQKPQEKEQGVFGPFFQFLDFISQPFYGLRNMQLNAVRALNGKPNVGAWEAYSSGFSLDPDKRVRNTMSDVFQELGVPEGLSVEVPILGKVSSRDTLALIIDIFDPSDPLVHTRLFSRTRKGDRAVAEFIKKKADDLAENLPGNLSKAEKRAKAEAFITEMLPDADKKAILRTMAQEAREGHRAIVQFLGVNVLPTPFNVAVFEAFGKAARALGHVPIIGEFFKNRPIKRVMRQFVAEAEASRNMRQASFQKRYVELTKMFNKLTPEQQQMIVPMIETVPIGFRRVIAQGFEDGLTTDEIVARLGTEYPKFQAEVIQQGKSLEQLIGDVEVGIRDRLGELTVGEMPGIRGASLPAGIRSDMSLDEYWAVRQAQGRGEEVDSLISSIAAGRSTITDAGPVLPPDLRKSAPRFARGRKNFQLDFDSDVDKALYITAQVKKSKRDADFRAFLIRLGLTDADIAKQGQRIRFRVGNLVEGKDPARGAIRVIDGGTLPKPSRQVIESPIDGVRQGDMVLARVKIEGLDKTRAGAARIIRFIPDQKAVEIEWARDIKFKARSTGKLRAAGIKKQIFTHRQKGQREVISLNDPNIQLRPRPQTIAARARGEALQTIRDRDLKEGVKAASKEFDELAVGYGRIAGAEVDPALRLASGKEFGIAKTRAIRNWGDTLDIGELTPLAKARALPEMKRIINDTLAEVQAMHIDDLQFQLGKELQIGGQTWLADATEDGVVFLRNNQGDTILATQMADANGIIKLDTDAFLDTKATDRLAAKIEAHLETVPGKAREAAISKSAQQFDKIDDAIRKAMEKDTLNPRQRIAQEIARNREARKTAVARVSERMGPGSPKPKSVEDYYVNQDYYDAIQVQPDAMQINGDKTFLLKAPDGSVIRGSNMPTPENVRKIKQAIEGDLATIAKQEVDLDLLDDAMEGYFPRFIRPEMRDAMERMIQTFSVGSRKKYSSWLNSGQHRTIRTMTTEEFNMLNRTGATRFGQIFNATERGKLTNLFSKQDPALGAFFDTTNPVIQSLRRVNKSIRAQTNAEFIDGSVRFFAKERGAHFKVQKVTDQTILDALSSRLAGGEDVGLYVFRRNFDKVVGDIGETTDDIAKKVQDGTFNPKDALRQIQPAEVKVLRGAEAGVVNKNLKDVFILPRETVNELEKVHRMWNLPESMNILAKTWRTILSLWKGYALFAPSYHFRNGISGMHMNHVAGVDLRSYEDAMPFMFRKMQKPERTFRTDVQGVDFTHGQVAEMIDDLGIRSAGIYGSELAEGLQTQLNRPSINPFRRSFFGLRGSRWVGQHVEDYLRVTHFVDQLRKTGNKALAQRSVNKFLFNYAMDLPQWERWATNIVPFWRWTRFNIPTQMQLAVTHPGKMRHIGVAKLYAESENEEVFPKALMPRFIKDGMGIPVRTRNGRTEFFLIRNWLPAAELDEVFKWVRGTEDTSGFQEVLKSAIDRAGPWKTPLEVFATPEGYSSYFRREIERFPGETGSFLADAIKVKLPGSNQEVEIDIPGTGQVRKKHLQWLRQFRPLNDLDKVNPFGVFGENRPGKVELPSTDRWVNYFTGGRLHIADRKKAYDQWLRTKRLKVQNLRAGLRGILRRSPAERQARTQEVESLQEMIRMEFEEMRKVRRPT